MRLGPRPFALHMAAEMGMGAGALAALPGARAGLLPWDASLAAEAAAWHAALGEVAPAAFGAAVATACQRRMAEMLAGIEAYRAHPYRRPPEAASVLWQEGATRLLDYGGAGVPALIIPSLINRYYVLDLAEDNSFSRWLAGNGVRPFVVDWGTPGEAERRLDLTGFVAGRLGRALDAVIAAAGPRRPAVLGYCMGGTLALALTQRRQQELSGLALLAAPWDFHAGHGAQAKLFGLLAEPLETILQAFGELPVDILQALFAWLDPSLAARKFRRFAKLDPESEAARMFVALEDWLNDGVALPPAVARECLLGWYGENDPAAGRWRICGEAVNPAAVDLPAFAAVPADDRIVPPVSARALAEALPKAETVMPAAGHIGMMMGRRARQSLWQPLAKWLHGLD